MATNFPSSLDNFTNPVSGNTLDSPSHSLQHSDANDAIEAIEAKLGVGNSPAGSATAGQVLTISAAGTSAWTTLPVDGLTQIIPSSIAVGSGSGSVSSGGAVTFSGASSVSLNEIFTTSYDNYYCIMRFTTSTGAELRTRLRNAGSDNSTTNYVHQFMEAGATSVSGFRGTGQTSFYIGYSDGGTNTIMMDLIDPKSTQPTGLFTRNIRNYASTPFLMIGSTGFNATTSFDGATIYPSSGTISGIIRIYGYKNG